MEDSATPPAATPPSEPTAPATGPEGPGNPFARLFGVLVSPGATFESIARRPDWLVPLIVWILVSIGATMVLTPRLDYEPMYRSLLERNPQLTEQEKEEQLDEMLESATTGRKWGMYAPLLTVPLMFLVMGGIFWGSLRAFGAENTFRESFAVSIYAFTPQLIKSIITAAIAATRTEIDPRTVNALLKSNLGAFTSPIEEPVIFAVLSSVDFFTIWTIILFAIGLSAISGFSKTRLAVMVVVFYLVVVVVKVGLAVLMGGLS
ncbi:MAG: Yip1 family protein [Thermoanaerobaculia bacterium]|nr:Yip1 family protein [Thermoanaerobaculia bacterium]